jgi:hypothetical protein
MGKIYKKTKLENISTWHSNQSKGSKTYYRYNIMHNKKKFEGNYDTLEECKKALLKCCINNNIPIKNYKKL